MPYTTLFRTGVGREDGPAKFDEIKRIGGTDSNEWFQVTVKEGRNREVRRLWESQGCQVSRLKRTRYGSVELPQPLLRGQSRALADDKVEALRRQLKLDDRKRVVSGRSVYVRVDIGG